VSVSPIALYGKKQGWSRHYEFPAIGYQMHDTRMIGQAGNQFSLCGLR
jgi:hypothetical protein